MNEPSANNKKLQNIATEEFFYFFLRMRKGEVRRIVGLLKTRYPEESPEQLAARLTSSKSRLSLLGGTLLSLPGLLPGVGQALKLIGVVGATSMLTRMHLYLIMEIALVFGEDLDDSARVRDLMAVVGATSLATATPWFARLMGFSPWYALTAGAMATSTATRLIGVTAVQYYSRRLNARESIQEEMAAPVLSPAG